MCDYSLMAIPNRLAVSGEELVVHRFEMGSVGMASASDLCKTHEIRKIRPNGFFSRLMRFLNPPTNQQCPAVCVPPGARLLVRDVPAKPQRELGLQTDAEEVVFTQTNAVMSFRDAIRFPNGAEVLLQRLSEGQRVRVFALSAEEPEESALANERFAKV